MHRLRMAQAEGADDVGEFARLLLQILGRTGAFFHHGGILLEGVVQLFDRLGDGANASTLFARGNGNFADNG